MEILFDGIPLDKVSTSMTINAPASVLLAMYIAVAEKQGVSPDKLRGTIQNDILKEYVARVEELGMNSAAITDHGVMYGVIDFYRAAKVAGIKPILGCEVYVAPGSRFDKTPGSNNEDRYYHLVLLAENQKGYENLTKIVYMDI